tara:strand:+ start:10533 stop:10649 length:117 start_codon:yes stop_codon:yes gene_type:complete
MEQNEPNRFHSLPVPYRVDDVGEVLDVLVGIYRYELAV